MNTEIYRFAITTVQLHLLQTVLPRLPGNGTDSNGKEQVSITFVIQVAIKVFGKCILVSIF